MTGYVLDQQALIAGLAGSGSERQRSELSRLLHSAIDGGPSLAVPAMCLSAAAVVRPAITDHLADIIAAAPPGAIDICGLTRSNHLDALLALLPRLGWPTTHAAERALATGLPILSVDPRQYVRIGLDVLTL